jgi:regulator of extracellular matrix RemA (YlzA/DUF370 family)
MMISIGHKSFLESSCIEEILTAHEPRAAKLKRLAAELGMLISATEGKRARSLIKLKTEHIVLSALEPGTLRSKLGQEGSSRATADDYEAKAQTEKNMQENHSRVSAAGDRSWGLEHPAFQPADYDEPNRRSGIERRRFSYTCHIPERRGGEDRRKTLTLGPPLAQ